MPGFPDSALQIGVVGAVVTGRHDGAVVQMRCDTQQIWESPTTSIFSVAVTCTKSDTSTPGIVDHRHRPWPAGRSGLRTVGPLTNPGRQQGLTWLFPRRGVNRRRRCVLDRWIVIAAVVRRMLEYPDDIRKTYQMQESARLR